MSKRMLISAKGNVKNVQLQLEHAEECLLEQLRDAQENKEYMAEEEILDQLYGIQEIFTEQELKELEAIEQAEEEYYREEREAELELLYDEDPEIFIQFDVTLPTGRERITIGQTLGCDLEYSGMCLEEGSYTFLEIEKHNTKLERDLELHKYLNHMDNLYGIEIYKIRNFKWIKTN